MREVEVKREDGSVVVERCKVAERPWSRMRGLLGRKNLPAGEGILLRPASSVHTFFMRFPIDVVFLDRSHEVIGVRERLGPWRLAGQRKAHSTLELPAGEATSRGVEIGDRLSIATS